MIASEAIAFPNRSNISITMPAGKKKKKQNKLMVCHPANSWCHFDVMCSELSDVKELRQGRAFLLSLQGGHGIKREKVKRGGASGWVSNKADTLRAERNTC